MSTFRSLLLNALPEKIKIEERYAYTLELSDTPINRPEGATGQVEIRLPYDGYTHLPRNTAEKLTEIAAEGMLQTYEAQIGWLLFSAPFNWQGDWQRQAGVSRRYRVVVPFPRDVLSDNPWLSDRLAAQLRSEYIPETPTYRPLQIEAQIYEQLPQDRDSYLREMLRLEAGQLLIFIKVSVEVPLALQHEQVDVKLDVLNLDWSTLASRQQIEFYQQHIEENITRWQQLAWRYNPDTKQVEISGAQYRRTANSLRQTEQFEFPIYMMLKFPGKILTENELRGNVQITLKNMLLSGYEVAWRGHHPESITPETETHLQANFTILLKDKMAQRKRSAFRRWMFAGVRLEDNRRHDLQAALYDLGYESDREMESEWQVFNRRFNAEDGSARLLTVHTRLKMLDEHSIEYQWDVEGGFLVKNAAPTGNLMVEVYADMNAPGSLLDFDLEKLMVSLQQRWQSVADLL